MRIINFILFGSILLLSCQSPKENPEMEESKSNESTEVSTPSLKSILDEKKAAFNERADEDVKKLYAQGIEEVASSGITDDAEQKGDKAHDFTLKNAKGEDIQLSELLKDGPVVLTWYRGGWCPYCNLTLARYQEELPRFKEFGAQLVALTPELPDKSLNTKEKNELEFEVLSDVGHQVARKYGVVYKLMQGVADRYQSGFGMHEYNGDESNELPLAATYVIDTNGIIQYAFLDADYRNRAEPEDILNALKELNK